jgi:hypothetical protein
MPFTFNLYAVTQAIAWTCIAVLVGRFVGNALRIQRMLSRERQARDAEEQRARRVDAAFLASHPRYQSPLNRGIRPGFTREHQATVIGERRTS